MPTYLYRCAKCGDENEVWQSFDEKPKTRHNGECGGKLVKVMSPAGIVLKGSGFYKTDNRSSKPSTTNGGRDKDSSSSSDTKSDSNTSDAKSSTKSDSASSSSPPAKETSSAKT
jgi:putative FmdB family regulatory protein